MRRLRASRRPSARVFSGETGFLTRRRPWIVDWPPLKGARAERAFLLALRAYAHALQGQVEDAWRAIDEAAATAEQLADSPLAGSVLSIKAGVHRLCCELTAACDTGRSGLRFLSAEALGARANLMMNMAISLYWRGDFAAAEALLPDLERLAKRAAYYGALWYRDLIMWSRDLMRSGNLQAFLAASERATGGAAHLQLASVVQKMISATVRLHTGQGEPSDCRRNCCPRRRSRRQGARAFRDRHTTGP
jgi:ATP/maltotriose-dependent transcriptional regulator MalT